MGYMTWVVGRGLIRDLDGPPRDLTGRASGGRRAACPPGEAAKQGALPADSAADFHCSPPTAHRHHRRPHRMSRRTKSSLTASMVRGRRRFGRLSATAAQPPTGRRAAFAAASNRVQPAAAVIRIKFL